MRNTDAQQTFSRIDVTAIINGARVLLDDGTYRVLSLDNASAATWWGEERAGALPETAGLLDIGSMANSYMLNTDQSSDAGSYTFTTASFGMPETAVRMVRSSRQHPAVIEALRSRIIADCRAKLFFGLTPDGARIEHSINLRRIPIQSLPEGLKVRDDLDLRATGIRSLPEGLSVGGDLLLSGQATPLLPSSLDVRGRILCCDRWGAINRPITAPSSALRVIDV